MQSLNHIIAIAFILKQECTLSKQMENQCAQYCYKAMKPLLEMAHQNQQKDANLAFLKEELGFLKQQVSMYKERESKNGEILKMAENIAAIKNQLSNVETNIKQFKDQCDQKTTTERTTEITTEKTTEKVIVKEPNSCISSGSSSNVQKIKVPGMEAFSVPCNGQIAGPGWTVIQQRLNGKTSFYRSWGAYRMGFGEFDQEFFIGLEKLHHMLDSQPHELYIWMEHMNKQIRYARYDNFMVGDENSQYQLVSLGKFSGNSKDALRKNVGMKFTTYDRDNDKYDRGNCAQTFNDAWWHAACSDRFVLIDSFY